MDYSELLRKIERIQALYARPGSEGEKRAAAAAIQRLQVKLHQLRTYAPRTPVKYEFQVFKKA